MMWPYPSLILAPWLPGSLPQDPCTCWVSNRNNIHMAQTILSFRCVVQCPLRWLS